MKEREYLEVTLIGMGLGNPAALTGEAREALEQADVLLGSHRLLEECPLVPQVQRIAATKSTELAEHLTSQPWKRPCVLYSGDTGFHSGARTLIPLLEEKGLHWRVIPGISSVQYFAARLGKAWQEWRVVSAHGLACDPVNELLCAKGKPVFFLTGGAGGAGELCQQLTQAGLGHLTVTVGEALSYPHERIRSGPVSQLAGKELDPLTVLLVEGLEPVRKGVSQGIADEAFLRDQVPMTKQEVRAAALGKLEVRQDGIYWDIGAGTGSVSVELALLAPAGRVYGIEYKKEGCDLVQANRRRFGAYNLTVVEGHAPQVLEGLPAPDGVFIGGSHGELSTILERIVEKNSQARVCITAIALETLGLAVAEMSRLGMHPQVSQVSVSRNRPVGELNLMMAQNPVWIITGQREEKR